MKNIICLFFMTATLSLASAPATSHFETSFVETVQLSNSSLTEITGGGPHVECMAAAMFLGFAVVAQQWWYVAMAGIATYGECFD